MLINYLNFWFSIPGVRTIIGLFEKEKYDIRFVGGCIRNALLNNKSSEIDLAVNCNPNITAKILRENDISILEYGKQYGTITAVIEKKNFEITSLRQDINPKGRYTEVVYTSDWYKDALRRDFTFNAINMNARGGLEDYFQGQSDLKSQQVRFIGDIEKRIQEDYLRIIRYFRFLGLFENLNLIEGYAEILYKYLPQVRKNISNDRIRIELLKMLKNKFILNSIVDSKNPGQFNILIKSINNWWIEDQYELGIKKCMNKINELIVKQ